MSTPDQFVRDMERIFHKIEDRAEDVMRESVQDLVTHAQTIRARGGSMRVDTGFLRASAQGAIGRIPAGPSKPEKGVKYKNRKKLAGMSPSAAIARWKPFGRVPVVIGWTANYALVRETKDGFLRKAVQLWPRFVNRNAAKVR